MYKLSNFPNTTDTDVGFGRSDAREDTVSLQMSSARYYLLLTVNREVLQRALIIRGEQETLAVSSFSGRVFCVWFLWCFLRCPNVFGCVNLQPVINCRDEGAGCLQHMDQTRARMHARTRARARTHTHTHTHARMHARTHTYAHTHTHTQTNTNTHIH